MPLPTPDEAEARFQAWVKMRNEKIAALRERSGLSMDDLAKEMGFRGQSSIQRYLSPDYSMGFRPEIANKFRRALIGKGEPPINDIDLQVFLDNRLIEPGDPVYDRGRGHSRNIAEAMVSITKETRSGPRYRAVLPLAEGEITLEIPSTISPSSAEIARVWAAHLINLVSDQADNADK
jgi:transcriptional regulator with XRE-family HTH domain